MNLTIRENITLYIIIITFTVLTFTASGPDVIHLGFPGGSHPLNFIFETEKAWNIDFVINLTQ